MKKKLSIVLMQVALFVAFVVVAIPSSYAEENETVESEDEALKAFTSPFGAKVRLLQLYKNLETQIIKGEEVINVINEVKPDYDLSELELVLENMKSLAEQINETVLSIPEEVDTETLQNLASDFVVLLNESRSLIRQFSELLHEDFSGEELAQIRTRVNENAKMKIQERVEGVREMIRQDVRAHNENIVKRMLNKPDVKFNESTLANKQELKNQVREYLRNVVRTQGQEITQLRERVKQMQMSHQQQVNQLKASIAKRVRQRSAMVQGKILERLHARLNKRQELIEKLAQLPKQRTNIDWKGRDILVAGSQETPSPMKGGK